MIQFRFARRVVSVFLVPVLLASAASAQVCPPEWSAAFGTSDIQGSSARAAVVWDDDGPGPHAPALYVAGFFDSVGGFYSPGIGKWDGKGWSTVGGGLQSFSGQPAYALAVFDDDAAGPHLPALYAAGDFFQAGSTPANWIAKWDGTNWTALGTGLSGGTASFPAARALAVFDEDGAGPNPPALFVGGDFTTAGGVTANRIARWNGTTWSALGTGTAGGSNSSVFALAVHDADGTGPLAPALYAGGMFGSLGGGSGSNLARWNGVAWTAVGASNFNSVTAIASVDHDGNGPAAPTLYVAGFFLSPINNAIARFDGTSWSAVAGGTDGFVWGMAAVDDDGAGPLGEALYVGGEFTHAGGSPANHVARFNGTSWSALGSGIDNSFPPVIVYAFAKYDDGGAFPAGYLYAVGFFDSAGGNRASKFARWDGLNWSSLHGGVDSSIRALQVFDEDGIGPNPAALFAAGEFTVAGGQPAAHVARFNGSGWSALSSGIDGSVYALCEFDSDGAGPAPSELVAAGSFGTAGGTGANNIARWNGSSWQALGSGISGFVLALAVFDDDGAGPQLPALYAGGVFTLAGGNTVSNIARWDGTTWSSPAGGMNDAVISFASIDPDGAGPLPRTLVAGGWFTLAGGTPASHIASWNGTAWSALGAGIGGPNPYPDACVAFDPDGAGPSGEQLITAGRFTSAGGSPAAHIASWNGSTWSTLGSGLDNGTWALLSFDADGAGPIAPVLYAGGQFSNAGGNPASCIAAWDGTAWSPLAGGVQFQFPFNNGVYALAQFDDDQGGPLAPAVYAGGGLEVANVNLSSQHIARWGAPLCPTIPFCFGDGSGTACPCGNTSAPGANSGCLNSLAMGGHLTSIGNASIAADTFTLVATGMLNGSALYFQGTTQVNGGLGVVFGDGLRCAGGTISRLSAGVMNVGGASQYPSPGDPLISVTGSDSAGSVRTYQCWYRNAGAFCAPATFNLTNGLQTTWQP